MIVFRDQQALLQKLEEVLRRRICNTCEDHEPDGSCKKDEAHDCALFNNLPRVVRSIAVVQSGNLDDYIVAIKGDVCEGCCPHARLGGSCAERDAMRCALDRYHVGIIATIEEVLGLQRMKAGEVATSG